MVGRRSFPFGARPIFRCENVSFRECTNFCPAIFVGNSWTTPSFRRDDPMLETSFKFALCHNSTDLWSMTSYLYIHVIWNPTKTKNTSPIQEVCANVASTFFCMLKRQFESKQIWLVVSKIFLCSPLRGKIPNLTNIFQRGWFNHQLDMLVPSKSLTDWSPLIQLAAELGSFLRSGSETLGF